jgi:cholera toxin transcriptional activator
MRGNPSLNYLYIANSFSYKVPVASMEQQRIRFDTFELNLHTGELHKQSRRIRLQDQPARLLILLASRPGQLVTRDEIHQALWKDGEFVEFEHAVNTAVRKIRVALEDDSEQPRIIETLPRKGYRFIGSIEAAETMTSEPVPQQTIERSEKTEDFVIPLSVERSRHLFLLAQIPYVATYLATFYYWYRLGSYLEQTFPIIPLAISLPLMQVAALVGFTVRVYLISLVGWGHTGSAEQFRRIFPALAILDGFWAATPLLVEHKLTPLVAWTGLILMGWLIFGQRTLMQRIGRTPIES